MIWIWDIGQQPERIGILWPVRGPGMWTKHPLMRYKVVCGVEIGRRATIERLDEPATAVDVRPA